MLIKKIAIRTLVYTLLWFIGLVIFSFFTIDIPELLDVDVFSYKFLAGVLEFFTWLPSIFASVFFVVLATYIDKDGDRILRSFSSLQMLNYQRIVLTIVVNVVLLFCAAEIFQPMINDALSKKENRYLDYNWYVEQSKDSHSNDEIYSALSFIDSALALYPESQEAHTLKELYERTPAEIAVETLEYFPEFEIVNQEDEFSTAATVLTMLEKAREAFKNNNYFDAHYYAFIGLELGGDNNPNSQELQMISLDSWNLLQTWSGFESTDDMKVFELKREGYAALVEGDALKAYYTFLDLYNVIPYDPDVMRYFELSKNALLNEYFFIDETVDLAHFEKAKNVSFSVSRSDGLFYTVHIGGVSNVRIAGNIVKYLRNYSCELQEANGTVLQSFSVPYVKLIGQPLASFNDNVSAVLNLSEEALVPRLLLMSVDRNTKGIVSAPSFTVGGADRLDDSLTLLPMSLEDFELILDASAGPQYINLASLLTFIPKAEQFGFSELVYSSFFLHRISYAFLWFSIFLFLAIQAWNFRLEDNSIFRFYWIIIVPIFTFVAEAIRQLISYGMSLISLALARVDGSWQIPTTLAVFVLLIIMFSVRFLSLHTVSKQK